MSSLRRVLFRVVLTLGSLTTVVFAASLVALLWGDPQFTTPPDVSPEAMAKAEIDLSQPYHANVRSFRMSDGVMLAAQDLIAADARTTIVLMHGMLGSSFTLNRCAGLLREVGAAEVVSIDLRGHGFSGGARGDTSYIGHYEDDLGEVVRQLRAQHPERRIVLAGHSMGGGVALRYAARTDLPRVDGYLLLAPYFGWSSPTTRKTADPEAEKFFQINLPRIAALKLFNSIGITAFNGMRTHFFNLPPQLPHRSYTFRGIEAGGPDDYERALAAIEEPLLVVVGTRDEAFVAEAYDPLVQAYTSGKVVVVPDATHNGILRDPRTMAAVREWIGSIDTAAVVLAR